MTTSCRMFEVLMDAIIEDEEDFILSVSSNDRAVNLSQLTTETSAVVQILDNTSKTSVRISYKEI